MKKFLSVFFLCAAAALSAQTQTEDVQKDVGRTSFPITISQFKTEAHYYGLPLSVKFGYFYRKNDVGIFPNAGFSFFTDGGPVLNTSTGFVLQKKIFTWDANAVYDILPFTAARSPDDQVFYGTSDFIFTLDKIKLSFPFRAGKKRRTPASDIRPSEKIAEVKTVVQFSQGLRFDFFIADLGYFKSTGSFSLFNGWIPADNFFDYAVYLDLPATFNLYYADIAFMYSFFNAGKLKTKTPAARNYETGKTQETLTGRFSFKNLPKYDTVHLFASELRWYAARTGVNANGFFLSLFADTGLGITGRGKASFIAEYGAGAGCTIFDSVPLTFQAGVNQDFVPVFYLGVMSRLSHIP